jgi:membrane fusion protein (multidrug efflux system)
MAIVMGLIAISACGSRAASESGGEGGANTRVPVGIAVVARDTVKDELVLSGRLGPQPGGFALLAAPAAGVISAVRAQIGRRVRRGDELLVIEVPELAAEESQREAAAAQARREAERQAQLLRDGVTSKRQAEEAEAAANQAESAAAAARLLLARTRIRAPLSGLIQAVRVQQGERVEAGVPLAEVIDVDTLDLHLAAPADRLRGMRRGLPVSVVQEGDSMPHQGWVSAVAPAVDSLTNAAEVVIRVPNTDGGLRAGAGATARVMLGVQSAALVIPESALVQAGDSHAVFVVSRDSIAHQRIVRTGVRQGGRVAVEGSLAPGDRVVTTGAFGLQDGMRVAPGSDTTP